MTYGYMQFQIKHGMTHLWRSNCTCAMLLLNVKLFKMWVGTLPATGQHTMLTSTYLKLVAETEKICRNGFMQVSFIWSTGQLLEIWCYFSYFSMWRKHYVRNNSFSLHGKNM